VLGVLGIVEGVQETGISPDTTTILGGTGPFAREADRVALPLVQRQDLFHEELNQIKLQTEEGQRLMLFLPPEPLARLRVGTPCLLQVAVQSMRESLQLPERDGAFW
jgi:hypothetical protein